MFKAVFLISILSFASAFAQDNASVFEENARQKQIESQAFQIKDWLLSLGDFTTTSII